jgi:hypothetical protein
VISLLTLEFVAALIAMIKINKQAAYLHAAIALFMDAFICFIIFLLTHSFLAMRIDYLILDCFRGGGAYTNDPNKKMRG